MIITTIVLDLPYIMEVVTSKLVNIHYIIESKIRKTFS